MKTLLNQLKIRSICVTRSASQPALVEKENFYYNAQTIVKNYRSNWGENHLRASTRWRNKDYKVINANTRYLSLGSVWNVVQDTLSAAFREKGPSLSYCWFSFWWIKTTQLSCESIEKASWHRPMSLPQWSFCWLQNIWKYEKFNFSLAF